MRCAADARRERWSVAAGWRAMKPSGESTGEECQRGPGPPTVSKARPAMIIQAWPALA